MKATLAVVCLAVVLPALATGAQETPDCGAIAGALETLEAYEVLVPPAASQDGWCVLDRAAFRSRVSGWPDFAIELLRLRPGETGVELDMQGLRATPDPSDLDMDDRLRSLMRLQTADLRLRAVHDPVSDVLSLSGVELELSGGT